MITSKKCPGCGHTKKLKDFYTNREYKDGNGYDLNCKICSKETAKDLPGLIKYCHDNHRQFSESLWETSQKTMIEKYKNDFDYNSLDEKQRELFLIEKSINNYFGKQNNGQYYVFVKDNTEIPKEVTVKVYEDKVENIGVPIEDEVEIEEEKKTYSKEWGGTYTSSQLEYLDSYYKDSLSDFNIVTRNHRDYARKIAKASLIMDEEFDKMINGDTEAGKRYKEAKAIFDTLSNSAKFSEKTRSNNDVAGLGSLSEIVARLEQTGFLQKKIEFEDDDIDKINKDLRNILNSMD